jgi:hypothetical protein
MRRDSAQFSCARHRGTVITGRVRCHAVPDGFVIKRKYGISCTSCLERTDLLKIFALKKEGCVARVIQPRIRKNGRAVNVWADPLLGCADRIQIEGSN